MEVNELLSLFLEKTEGVEYNSFWFGVSREKQGEKEKMRKLGMLIEEMGKKATPIKPDLIGILGREGFEIKLRPLYIYGRYAKFSRFLPQTMFSCKICNGRGCAFCGNTGKAYEVSVDELIGEPLKEEANAKDYTLMALGREDADVKMLGNGRPFILKLEDPLKRSLDLGKIKDMINEDYRIKVSSLLVADDDLVEKVKHGKVFKEYVALVECEGKVDKLNFKKEYKIMQRTPTRVLHRRPDLLRERKITINSYKLVDESSFVIDVTAEHGTYIKEFISGDNGRTKPSVSELLGKNCRVYELDCVKIFDSLPLSSYSLADFSGQEEK